MTITIAPDGLLELAFARLDLEQAQQAISQARGNYYQANSELQDVREQGPILYLQDYVLKVAEQVASQLDQGQPVDWEDFDWVFGQQAAEQAAEAKRDQADADLAAAQEAARRAERIIKARTAAICQPIADELWQAEQANEAAELTYKQAADNHKQAKAEAADLVKQVWRIRQEGGGETELEAVFDQGQEIKALLDQARGIVSLAETKLTRTGQTSSKTLHRLLRARRGQAAAEEEVGRQLSQMVEVLERQPEWVIA